jgi:hypothetical protein
MVHEILSRFGDRNKAPVEALRGRGISAKRQIPLLIPRNNEHAFYLAFILVIR